MKPTLRQLYYGDLCPQQEAGPDTPDAYETFAHSQERLRELIREQAPELEKKFTVLIDEFQSVYTIEREEMFHYGFGLAVKLLFEGLSH